MAHHARRHNETKTKGVINLKHFVMLKKVIAVGVCVVGVFTSSVGAVYRNSSDIKSELDTAISMKNAAHQMADCARQLGATEDSYIITEAKSKWDEHNQTVVTLTQEYNAAVKAEKQKAAEEAAKKKAEEAKNSKGTYLGTFRISRYCSCSICNGGYSGTAIGTSVTAIGTSVTAGRTIAVDPSVIPLGSWVYIEGIGWRVAEDTGGAIRGQKIDLAVSSHSQAYAEGISYAKVYVKAK